MKEPGSEFIRSENGSKLVYLHREIAPQAPALLKAIDHTLNSGKRGAGNRESGFAIDVDGAPQLFVRRSRRGGMMRFLGDLYLGFVPRMISELNVLSEARHRGVPVPQPMGVIVERVGPAMYRGAVITKAIPGMTMLEFVKVETDSRSLSHVLRMARYSIDTMHEQGLIHDDLNLNNLYVSMAGDGFTVVVLDFDKARLQAKPLSRSQRKRSLQRLAKSIRKLDPEGRYLNDASLKIVTE